MLSLPYAKRALIGLVLILGMAAFMAVPQDVRAQGVTARYVPGQIIVRSQHNLDGRLDPARYPQHELLVPRLNIYLIRLADGVTVMQAMAELNRSTGILYAQPDHYVTDRATVPNDPFFYRQWGLYATGENFRAEPDWPECGGSCGGDASCAGQCGGGTPSGCYCDPSCLAVGDCCADACDQCGVCDAANSCSGNCGSSASGGCWCDDGCLTLEDCCGDACSICGICGPAEGECHCGSGCVDLGSCCTNACDSCGHCSSTVGADVDARYAWDYGFGLDGPTAPVVVVIDSGIDLDHPDLVDNLWTNPDEIAGNWLDDDLNGYVDDIHGWDAGLDTGTLPETDHGTKVTGVCCARGDNGLGISGISWRTRFMFVSKTNDDISLTSAVIKGYNYIMVQRQRYMDTNGTMGANVVVAINSFGIPEVFCTGPYQVWNDLYDEMGSLGILSVVAVPNTEVDIDVVGDIPGTCTSDYVITVTNVDEWQTLKFAASGTTHVDLAAPGEHIYTTEAGGGYGFASGTSFAAPLVGGGVAFLHSVAPLCFWEFFRDRPDKAALYLKSVILDSVDLVVSLVGETVTGGRFNLYWAVNQMQSLNTCGDGCCTGSETVSTCPMDCVGTGSCCRANGGVGCQDIAVQDCVCALDEVCCNSGWDDICGSTAEICGSCSGDCCEENGSPGCLGTTCEDCVCNADSYCCTDLWDGVCVLAAGDECAASCVECDVCGNDYCGDNESACSCSFDCGSVCGDGCCTGAENPCDCPGDCSPICGDGCCTGTESSSSCFTDCVGGGGCCLEKETAGCGDLDVQACVCGIDPYCCTGAWDGLCAAAADDCGSCNGSCCGSTGNPGCDGTSCEACVCDIAPTCCTEDWWLGCATYAQGACVDACSECNVCIGLDCNDNDPCTIDSCGSPGGCSHDPVNCAPGTQCVNGSCICLSDCVGKTCGSDGCGGSCGTCGAGESCNGGNCSCDLDCVGKTCGDDGCGGSCGTCGPGESCNGGNCSCDLDCVGKTCGDDGCGGSCGTCEAGQICSGGSCICVPSCPAGACGPDGCGGSCGPCPDAGSSDAGNDTSSGTDSGTGVDSGSDTTTDTGSGVDAGTDAGNDTTTDTGSGGDAGTDAASDTTTDTGSGVDTGTDAGNDTAADTGSGVDAGTDAGNDTATATDPGSGVDTGTDAGTDSNMQIDTGPETAPDALTDTSLPPLPKHTTSSGCRAGSKSSGPYGLLALLYGLLFFIWRRRTRAIF